MTYILIILALLAAGLLILFYSGFFMAALYLAYFVMIFCVFALVILVTHFYRVTIKGNAPYIRTGKKLIDRVIEDIDFKDNAKVYELGSGDGRFLRALAKKKNVRAVGFENFMLPYTISKAYKYLNHSKADFLYQDLFKADLSDADYIFCYLITTQMDKLETKLQNELKPGTLIISNTFKFKNWPLEKQIIINPNNNFRLSNKINIYRKV